MSIFQYLQLQPVDSQDDGTISELDRYDEDEVIDLTQEEDGEKLLQEWEDITRDMHEGSSHS